MPPPTHNSDHNDKRRSLGVLSRELSALERSLIADALAYSRGSQVLACVILGVSKVFLWRAIERHGLDLQTISDAAEAGDWDYKTTPEGAPWLRR
jgi:DNA-binding NtrC family response regulator